MATTSFTSILLLLFSACFHAVFARPLTGPEHTFADTRQPLSQALTDLLERERYEVAKVSSDLHQQVIDTSSDIDQFAALDDDTPVSKRAAAACRIAHRIFPGRVYASNDIDYQYEREINWSQTCWLPAACFIRLRSNTDVAAALKVISHVGSKFAVRSGGHNPNAGFGSIDESGVLLDLQGLDDISLGKDDILHAGPGGTWGKVYDFLDPHGITAIGGRHYTVGLPGFLLGGGMTFFPNLYGLGTDSVKNFEVVLANSTIVNANANENHDLFRALKGGGPNYGIVTRFDIETHPLHNVQYSLALFDPSDYANVLNATVQVQAAMEEDPKIGFFLNVNKPAIIAGLLYADWPAAPPKAFEAFTSLPSYWGPYIPLTNGTIASLTSAINIGDFPAKREPYAVSTLIDHDLYVDVHERYIKLLETDMPTANLSYTIQPVARAAVKAGQERGGNALGLEAVPQSWWAPLVEWFDDSTDEAAHFALDSLGKHIQSSAGNAGKLMNYQFMNDASYSQTILDSYGSENVRMMKDVAEKYDPNGLFQKLQHDGFLLRKF